MPVHDWARVQAGTWHDFHVAWIAELRLSLNDGLLPASYYAQAEQLIGPMGPDVLAPQSLDPVLPEAGTASGGLALATTPPKIQRVAGTEAGRYTAKQRSLVIRHASGDRVVALIELVSPGNKAGAGALRSFVEKAVGAIQRGYHLLIVDLFPPGVRDPDGIPDAIWEDLCGEKVGLPENGRSPSRPSTRARPPNSIWMGPRPVENSSKCPSSSTLGPTSTCRSSEPTWGPIEGSPTSGSRSSKRPLDPFVVSREHGSRRWSAGFKARPWSSLRTRWARCLGPCRSPGDRRRS